MHPKKTATSGNRMSCGVLNSPQEKKTIIIIAVDVVVSCGTHKIILKPPKNIL